MSNHNIGFYDKNKQNYLFVLSLIIISDLGSRGILYYMWSENKDAPLISHMHS